LGFQNMETGLKKLDSTIFCLVEYLVAANKITMERDLDRERDKTFKKNQYLKENQITQIFLCEDANN